MAWHRYGEIIGVDVFECLLSSEGNRDDAHFYSGYKIKVLKCLFSLEDYIHSTVTLSIYLSQKLSVQISTDIPSQVVLFW